LPGQSGAPQVRIPSVAAVPAPVGRSKAHYVAIKRSGAFLTKIHIYVSLYVTDIGKVFQRRAFRG
jgi:hypothetical protein